MSPNKLLNGIQECVRSILNHLYGLGNAQKWPGGNGMWSKVVMVVLAFAFSGEAMATELANFVGRWDSECKNESGTLRGQPYQHSSKEIMIIDEAGEIYIQPFEFDHYGCTGEPIFPQISKKMEHKKEISGSDSVLRISVVGPGDRDVGNPEGYKYDGGTYDLVLNNNTITNWTVSARYRINNVASEQKGIKLRVYNKVP